MLARLKGWAAALKDEVVALYVAAKDRRTPFLAKLVAGATAAYALSPIDLIPDFIPVIGLLDDLILVPLGIWLAMRLIPTELMAEYREVAARIAQRPTSPVGLLLVIALWMMAIALVGLFFLNG
ncbi:YkvA family protein [Qipengyuania sp.]|uniref:YkvA family protein n=1 Tax=Qipengyuania sp. TaxID=2004515 RepID=UPI003AF8ABF9